MKIYTKTGDLGETSLLGGTRVLKNNVRIEAYGGVDELNAYIGLLSTYGSVKEQVDVLNEVQDRLFTIGSVLAAEKDCTFIVPDLKETDLELLETQIDTISEKLPVLRQFVLPGGHAEVAMAHVGRTVCRRIERKIVELNQLEVVEVLIIKYLNRLSDYLFVLSRYISFNLDLEEKYWKARV